MLKPHQTGEHLAERAVAADTGHDVVFLAVRRGKLRGVTASGREEQRRAEAAPVEQMQRVGQIQLITAAPRGGVDDQHQFFVHDLPSFKRCITS